MLGKSLKTTVTLGTLAETAYSRAAVLWKCFDMDVVAQVESTAAVDDKIYIPGFVVLLW